MRNLIKKSLAFCLVAALALTCFVGSVSAAETYSATISVANQTITQGTTSVDVVLDIASADAGINEALIKVSSTLGTIASEATVVESDSAAVIEYDQGTTDYGTFYLSAQNVESETGTALGSVKSAKIKLTFTVAADVAVGDYDIVIDIPDDKVIAASANEDIINFTYTTAKVTVEAAVSEPVVDTAVLMGRGIVAENKVGVKLTVYDQYVSRYSDYTLEMKIGYYDIENTANPFGYNTKTVLYKNFADDEEVTEGYVKQNSYSNGQAVYIYYVAAYEYTCPVEVKLHLFDENGKEVAVSQTWTFTVSNRILSTAVKGQESDTVYVDLMNYGAAVQTYFAAKYPESDLAKAALPTVGYENSQQFATPDSAASLDTIKSINIGEAFNGSKAAVGKGLLIEDSNIVRFLVVPAAGQDVANLTLKVVFNDTIYGNKTVEVKGSDLVLDGGKYYYYFRDIALYDTEATINAELYEGDTHLYTRTYSVESGLYDIKSTAADVCKAIEKLTVSLWKTLPGLQGK